VPGNIRFAFVHVDLDHYEPTRVAMHWAWKRMLPSGVLCSHDYKHTSANASGGIQAFLAELDEWAEVRSEGVEFMLRKRA